MRIKINRRSPAYYRVINAGFRIKNINLIKIKDIYYPIIIFQCVCGRKERFINIRYTKENIPHSLDVAKMMEDGGALSEEHLIEDGYTSEQIASIRAAYK